MTFEWFLGCIALERNNPKIICSWIYKHFPRKFISTSSCKTAIEITKKLNNEPTMKNYITDKFNYNFSLAILILFVILAIIWFVGVSIKTDSLTLIINK